MKEQLQKIVNAIPLSSFGKLKVRWADDTHKDCLILPNSFADGNRIIAGLREKGYTCNYESIWMHDNTIRVKAL